MTVSSAPIGSTAQSLDGFAVDANVLQAFRESVVITDPTNSTGAAPVTSTYGLAVNVMSTVATPVNVTTQVTVSASTQIISSIPFYVSQSTSPWVVSTAPVALAGTSQVFGSVSTQVVSSIPFYVSQSTTPWVVSSAPIALTGTSQVFGTVSSQIVSSIPLIVSQSTVAWQVQVTNVPQVNLTTSIPLIVAQSSSPWGVSGQINVSSHTAVVSTFPLGTTSTQIVSSLPLIVAQSSSPWGVSGGINVTAAAWAAATTAVSPAQVLASGTKVIVASLPSTTGAGNMQNEISDSAGRQIVHLYNSRELIGTQGTAMTSVASTSETTIVTASSATFRDLCELVITTNGTVAGAWRLRDATATTSPVYIFNTPATQGSILNLLFQPPLKQGLVNNNWTLQSNNVSTQGNIVAIYTNTQ